MTTQQVADKYHELAQQNKWTEIMKTLYHDDIVCIEPPNSKSPPYTKGQDDVMKKAEHFESITETVHNAYSTNPIVAGNLFAVGLGQDLTIKGVGRTKFDEFGIFTVENGKIVREEFSMHWADEGGHEYQT